MKTYLSIGSGLALLIVVAPLCGNAQSIGRIRQSLDKATGGATAARARSGTTVSTQTGAPAPDPQVAAQLQAQVQAADALATKRNKAALVGADQRVVDFLKQRIADGSADAAYELAKRYEEGRGVEADPVEARRLYALAAERDNEDAKKWLEENPAPPAPAIDPKAASLKPAGASTNLVASVTNTPVVAPTTAEAAAAKPVVNAAPKKAEK
ncbi:MAG TPA: SEL1-like repeat protein [Candidatus Limnocylindria bacterium]|jgi:hypothetical protein|nr:SEL1-like repeat protein [Candidatus Limnocylindria bacterium]